MLRYSSCYQLSYSHLMDFALTLSNALAGDMCLSIDGYEVICRQSDGYVNATALCKAGGKEYKHWKECKKSKDFLSELALHVEISTGELTMYEDHGRNNRATWVHPQVAIAIAQDISPRFAVRVTSWIHELMIFGSLRLGRERGHDAVMAEQLAQMRSLLEEKDGIIQQRDDKIDALQSEIAAMRREMQEAIINSRLLLSSVSEERMELRETRESLKETNGELRSTKESLEETNGELRSTREALSATEVTLATTTEALTTTTKALTATEVTLATTTEALVTTEATLATTNEALATTNESLATTNETLSVINDSLELTQEILIDVAQRAIPIGSPEDKKERFMLFKTEKGYYMAGVQERTVEDTVSKRKQAPILSIGGIANAIIFKGLVRKEARRTKLFSVRASDIYDVKVSERALCDLIKKLNVPY